MLKSKIQAPQSDEEKPDRPRLRKGVGELMLARSGNKSEKSGQEGPCNERDDPSSTQPKANGRNPKHEDADGSKNKSERADCRRNINKSRCETSGAGATESRQDTPCRGSNDPDCRQPTASRDESMREVPAGSKGRSERAKLCEDVENPMHWLFKTNAE